MQSLFNKQIVLGVTGGIAAYKSAYLVRVLQGAGAVVRVVMTEAATTFVTPLTFQALTGAPVLTDSSAQKADDAMDHIALAKWADVVVIAPATANSIANVAAGKAEDLLSTLCVATAAKIMLAPAMNQQMWQQASTQENIQTVQQRGIHIIGPAKGEQACGDVGPGRMVEPEEIAAALAVQFDTGLLAGKRLLITAGPTREPIDPMRYLSNRSTGKMGYALAAAAIEMGAQVILVSGPVHVPTPERAQVVPVETAKQMQEAVVAALPQTDWMIASAAVADFRPQKAHNQKLKKTDTPTHLALELNPDIVAQAAQHPDRPKVVAGFAAETEKLATHAADKLARKNLDLIIANKVGSGVGVEVDDNAVTVFWQTAQGVQQQAFALASKMNIARQILQQMAKIYG